MATPRLLRLYLFDPEPQSQHETAERWSKKLRLVLRKFGVPEKQFHLSSTRTAENPCTSNHTANLSWRCCLTVSAEKGFKRTDEPEVAFSPLVQLAVLSRIHDLVMDDSQFIIATHSPILMAYPNATIYSFSVDGIKKLDYYETEHYQVTRDFLINPKRMLNRLLEPSDKPLRPARGKPARR